VFHTTNIVVLERRWRSGPGGSGQLGVQAPTWRPHKTLADCQVRRQWRSVNHTSRDCDVTGVKCQTEQAATQWRHQAVDEQITLRRLVRRQGT